MFKGCFHGKGDQDTLTAAERKTIDGNPPVNPAWISFELILTGKTPANLGNRDEISQNP
ncbi:hypothetical protein [Paenibacillus radicis (ex Xue et al. 2023)]|uniref:Uncharacterized protein n=1 Tax=Paenibacillus radicis (ex Xue et al. 2023) TaxID=2972489 RepID=A0ABT1YDE3_9BACL|nr:hypothetical protein [Paenibacillus radicis (ex Xue et al. 2023)]MCR8631191.1 hypothetical protein [Paenibacillus radicis (ex Xue et al. 2023)]